MPVMFSAMSYGSSATTRMKALKTAEELGMLYNTERADCTVSTDTAKHDSAGCVRPFRCSSRLSQQRRRRRNKNGQAKPGIGEHLPGAKIVGDMSRTRMIRRKRRHLSAPHHDIYSIEDLRLTCLFDKGATNKAGYCENCGGA